MKFDGGGGGEKKWENGGIWVEMWYNTAIHPRSLPVSSRTERGYFLPEIPTVPMKSRKLTATWRQPDGPPVAIAFVDGQNLFHAARRVFGRQIPDYDVLALSRRVCEMQGWRLARVHFYTGVPLPDKDPRSRDFWRSKLRRQDHQGVRVFSRPLHYRAMGNGEEKAEEKGVDVRIAVDIIRAVLREECDVALMFSQDQDFSEVAREVREIAREQRRWIKIASAFPSDGGAESIRGVNDTDWVRIDRDTYDLCLDPRDHFPPD